MCIFVLYFFIFFFFFFFFFFLFLFLFFFFFFFSSRRRHTRFDCDWSSDVCSSDLRFARGFPAPTWGAAFSPDGSAVAVTSRKEVARVYDAATGRERCSMSVAEIGRASCRERV